MSYHTKTWKEKFYYQNLRNKETYISLPPLNLRNNNFAECIYSYETIFENIFLIIIILCEIFQ